jgi:hypothetical protein
MTSIREIIETSTDPEHTKELLTRHDGPFRMLGILSQKEQDDVLDGLCVYSEYEGQVILNYTKKWGIG